MNRNVLLYFFFQLMEIKIGFIIKYPNPHLHAVYYIYSVIRTGNKRTYALFNQPIPEPQISKIFWFQNFERFIKKKLIKLLWIFEYPQPVFSCKFHIFGIMRKVNEVIRFPCRRIFLYKVPQLVELFCKVDALGFFWPFRTLRLFVIFFLKCLSIQKSFYFWTAQIKWCTSFTY